MLQLIGSEIVPQHFGIIEVTAFACCDFIAQFILVRTTGNSYHLLYLSNSSKDISLLDYLELQYLCCDPSFILSICILRSIAINFLHSLTDFNLWFLVIWIAAGSGAPLSIVQDQKFLLAGLMLPLTVNALVTGLIAFRIFKVFQEVKTRTADGKNLAHTGGSTLRRIMFILVESGMALFSIQFARLVGAIVLTSDAATDAATDAYSLITGIHVILTVVITSVIATLFC